MSPRILEIYSTAIQSLGENEKLQLATLILEEVTQSRNAPQLSSEERTAARRRLQQFAGSVASGNPHSSDNEQIDKDLALESFNSHENEK